MLSRVQLCDRVDCSPPGSSMGFPRQEYWSGTFCDGPHSICAVCFSLNKSTSYLSKQKYWSGLLFPTPRDFLNPGIESTSLASPALRGGFFTLHHLGSPSPNFQKYHTVVLAITVMLYSTSLDICLITESLYF